MYTFPYLDQLLYCLEQNFPAPVTEALLTLIDNPYTLPTARVTWRTETLRHDFGDDTFADAVYEITGTEVYYCDDCGTLVWDDETTWINDEQRVCDDQCAGKYYTCDLCEDMTRSTTSIDGLDICDGCYENDTSYCDHCDVTYLDRNSEDHDHPSSCECSAPRLGFRFPANGAGTVRNDERLTVELPKGTIDEEGINKIRWMLHDLQDDSGHYLVSGYVVNKVLDDIGPLWQAKRGNFTRRLSSGLWKQDQVKLPADVLSEVGNIARLHSSDGAIWHIEFTRDLNQDPSHFAHSDSCWWSENDSYGRSRCALKNWGGMGMRSYFSPDADQDNPTGRVWVQPVDADMMPTHDTTDAVGYVVFNGYSDLDGYVSSRIVAHLTGKTYKKIQVTSCQQYINNGTGFLVADEETCNAITRVEWDFDVHNTQDHRHLPTMTNADQEAA